MGLMGSVATSTYVKRSSFLGIIARVFKENAQCRPTIGKELPFWSIPKRLALMFNNADAFIALPGSFDNVVENGFVFPGVRNFLIAIVIVVELSIKLQVFEYHPDLITQQI
ncbi:hypothetical protein Goklo_024854, partial [Gossypium klotzschianum]|nr:hypothetical protein [Gossypium klotzschianum]